MLKKSLLKGGLISPYGGSLVNLVIDDEKREELMAKASSWPSLQLTARSLQDLELLATGAFSPLNRFMTAADYRQVMEKMRLTNGLVFPIPITLPLKDPRAIRLNRQVVLRGLYHEMVAIMTVEEIYRKDFKREASLIYQTLDFRHPLIAEMASWGDYYISGRVEVLQLPKHYDFTNLRLTPAQTRTILSKMGNSEVVAFQTRNPMHKVHEYLTKQIAKSVKGTLLIHPTAGITKVDDIDYFTRIFTHKVVYERYYNHHSTLLGILPLAMRFAGPREAVWHAVIRRNYGANYFIVGRDHAGPGLDSKGKPFYKPEAAQELIEKVKNDIGVKPLCLGEVVYVPGKKQYLEVSKITSRDKFYNISGTKVRDVYLANHKHLPRWYTRPEVASILAEAYVPMFKKGFCVWFTGLPCAGKSTIASIVQVLLENVGRRVTLLDGDVVRTHLSKGLGFSKEDRDANILRIGFVAAEIVKHNGVAICAAVSPYEETREQVRHLVPPGAFILVYIDTPLGICEKRDDKGLYKQARKGIIKNFTGVSDPYQPPARPELHLYTVEASPQENAQEIFNYLKQAGFIK